MPECTLLFIAQPASVSAVFPYLKEAGIKTGIAENLAGALNFINKKHPLMVFSQAKIGSYTASSILEAGADIAGFPPVIVFSDQANAKEAQELMELGAKDFWVEPLVWEKIQAVLPSQGKPSHPDSSAKTYALSERYSIIGKDKAMQRVLALSKRVAKSKATVLISGESGTGKEMFARFLHSQSDRANGPFVAINCAALPEHLLESELFGHEKGAFTGAIARKLGKFELANGGTILLDEISEMDIGLQAKLLRVLQESEFDRVGGSETIGVDVRVLATTNRDLKEHVDTGKFRLDLYYRLNVIPLRLPALRERGEDVLLLTRHFVERFSRMYELGKIALSEQAEEWILSYDWPGNVRELQNLMERAVLLAGGGPVHKAHFLLDSDAWPFMEEDLEEDYENGLEDDLNIIGENVDSPTESEALQEIASKSSKLSEIDLSEKEENTFPEGVVPLEEVERVMILRSLDKTSGNRTQAAQLLGISVRTLRNKLSEYRSLGIDVP